MEIDISVEIQLYNTLGIAVTNIIPDKDSAEYNGCTFNLDNRKVIFRAGKITPTKNGQFVTLYKRIGNNPIAPFESTDEVDFVVIAVTTDTHSGHFIFPKTVLCKQKIVTDKGVEGKRAFRVYPVWDVPQSKQATITQKWQLNYFVEIKNGCYTDAEKAGALYKL